jgi:hypothetical protein
VGAFADWFKRNLVDAVSTIAVPAQSGTAKYYNECLMKKEITAHNLAEEMKVIVQTELICIPSQLPVHY